MHIPHIPVLVKYSSRGGQKKGLECLTFLLFCVNRIKKRGKGGCGNKISPISFFFLRESPPPSPSSFIAKKERKIRNFFLFILCLCVHGKQGVFRRPSKLNLAAEMLLRKFKKLLHARFPGLELEQRRSERTNNPSPINFATPGSLPFPPQKKT